MEGDYNVMVIDLLGLSNHRHTVVGDANRRGLSGGQRKRVNVGIELVADPSLIFLDEPTSGLDSTAALELMQALHRLSNFGVAVCAVLHQLIDPRPVRVVDRHAIATSVRNSGVEEREPTGAVSDVDGGGGTESSH